MIGSNVRLVERFFSVVRHTVVGVLVSHFQKRSDKGTKVPTEARYDRWACHAPGIKTARLLVDKSKRRRYYGTPVTHFYAPQLRGRRVIGRWSRRPREIAWPEMCSRRKSIYGTFVRPEYSSQFSARRTIFLIGKTFGNCLSEIEVAILLRKSVISSENLFSF